MSWVDGRGHKVTRAVNQVINVRDFIGTPGYALLLVAANTNLSGGEIDRYLKDIAGVGRSRNWIQKRRWLFQPPGTAIPLRREMRTARTRVRERLCGCSLSCLSVI